MFQKDVKCWSRYVMNYSQSALRKKIEHQKQGKINNYCYNNPFSARDKRVRPARAIVQETEGGPVEMIQFTDMPDDDEGTVDWIID